VVCLRFGSKTLSTPAKLESKRGFVLAYPGCPENWIVKPEDVHGTAIVEEGDKMTAYRATSDDTGWLRFPDEFEDGRFEDIP